jgi:hypothetical protein
MRKGSWWKLVVVGVASLGGATGCGRGPIVSQSELPIRRVVVYRNGVAYFERAGHVENDAVRFKMRQAEVGDFLATLAVMEQGGSSVRSAAFPLRDEEEEGEARDPKDPKAPDPQRVMRTVVLSLDGRAHDLQVGYIAASPVWRPSYRLVMQQDGQADLQAWGIVENLSGEDWGNVQLSLVAGAPLAFEAQLGTPIIPDRPIVTDQGEVIVSVPHAETSLAQKNDEEDQDRDGKPDDAEPKKKASDKSGRFHAGGAPPAPPPPPGSPAASAAPVGQAASLEGGTGTRAKGEEGSMGNPNQPARGFVSPSGPRNIRSLAAVAVQGGTTRYDIPSAVDVPDKAATMVMLLSRRVKGESLFLFAPDDGVPDSAGHPFHVARFENGTPGVLERGPIAVFQQGSFLGQGMVDPLPAGASATVPFALERAIGVSKHMKTDMQGTRVSKIANGQLWLEHDLVFKTIYEIENGGELPAKMLVKHSRANGSRLYQPPAGTEDNTGTGSALVPGTVGAHSKTELVVDERQATKEYADWFGAAADKGITAYMADPRADQKVVQALQAAWPLRAQIVAKQDQRSKVQIELSQLQAEAQEKRADLRAIEKNKAAEALRTKLTARLTAIAARQDVLTAQSIQLGQDLSELQIRWRDAVRAIDLPEAPPPKSGS